MMRFEKKGTLHQASDHEPDPLSRFFNHGIRRIHGKGAPILVGLFHDSSGAKATHWATQHLQAWTCMDRRERQSNWPDIRKTLGTPEFLSGEDRNPTFRCLTNLFEEFERQNCGPTDS
jgi:hypothetical protein